MELLTILLSGLLTVLSPIGFIVDRTAAKAIRSSFSKVEQLQVRVDNAPSYQLAQGKVQQVRIAGRGMWPTPEVRIDTLELETDPISVDINAVRKGGSNGLLGALRQPGQAGLRLVLTEKDLNQALQTPQVKAQLQQTLKRIGSSAGSRFQRSEIKNATVDFLDTSRIRFDVELADPENPEPLTLSLESGLGVISGRQLSLIKPVVILNGKPLPAPLVTALTGGLSKQLDLRNLEERGILGRILKLQVDSDRLELATFVRVEPKK